MLRCFACHRPLLRCAVPNLQIGPKCAADRGLLPRKERPARFITVINRSRRGAEGVQIDWINNINTGAAGESAAA